MRKLLPLLLVPVLVLAIPGGATAAAAPPTAAVAAGPSVPAAPAAPTPAAAEQEFLQRLNQTRQQHGRAPLVLDAGLSHDARVWSSVMADRNLLHHTDSSRMVRETQRVVPDWRRLGENVGVGHGVGSLHDAFWNSPGHRDNMLGDFNRVGVGVVHGGGRIWVTFRYVSGPPIAGPTGLSTSISGFSDVYDSAYYASAVAWLARTGVTTGIGSSDRFEPDRGVTRAQMATFLWRLAGEPRARAVPFSDVPASAYYAPAVAWLRAAGLTTGMGGGNRFHPDGVVTREQMAAFLYRFAGEKPVGGHHGFVDVAPTSFADQAVAWLARYGITTGVTPQRFDPTGPVTRGQMATFLHRLHGSRAALGTGAQRIAA